MIGEKLQSVFANERGREASWLDDPGRVSPEEAVRAWRAAGMLDRGPVWLSAGQRILFHHAWPMILDADRCLKEMREKATKAENAGSSEGGSGEAGDLPGVVRVLHVGARSGDLTLALADRCRSRRIRVSIEAIDWNRDAIALLKNREDDFPEIVARTRDVFEMEGDEFAQAYDVVIASNAFHRLSPSRWTLFVSLLARLARTGVVIYGLARSPTAWCAASFVSGVFGGRVLRRDAPIAVRRAASFDEWAKLAQLSGLPGIALTAHAPFRAALSWRREA